jgi:NAD(P)-dependent dehydrogenase (short-subunit alcohol dehydrogenase family)
MSDRLATGAGSGIGEAICVRFAEEGADVVVTTRDPQHLRRTLDRVRQGDRHEPLGLEMDVADGGSVTTAVTAAVERFGRIDVLCANAGIDLSRAPAIDDVTDDEWNMVMAVNVTGTFLVTRAAVPHIPEGGAVVTIGSINSFVGWPDNVPYTTSKGAVLQFTRALALDLAPRGIRANCVCPGIIDTPLTRAFIEAAPDPDDVVRAYDAAAPLGRMGTAREVANAALFLASDEASFITGAALLVDGGTTAIA